MRLAASCTASNVEPHALTGRTARVARTSQHIALLTRASALARAVETFVNAPMLGSEMDEAYRAMKRALVSGKGE